MLRRLRADGRAVLVELTDAGEEMFLKLARAATSFDKRLRTGLAEDEVDAFRDTLARLRANVGAE